MVGVLLLFVLFLVFWFTINKKRMNIPGPRGLPIFGVSHLLKPSHKNHVKLAEWCQKYGPVMKVPLLDGDTVVLSGTDAIHEVMIKKGRAFGGRPHSYRGDVTTERTGILTSREADDKWKLLRTISHRHLKQFGDGMSKLESVIEEVGQDMFSVFAQNCGKPFDPNQDIFDAALNSIAFLITGERTRSGDDIVEKMRHYEEKFLRTNARNQNITDILTGWFPIIRNLQLESWKALQRFVNYELEIWNDLKCMNNANPLARSLCKILMNTVCENADTSELSEKDARRTSMNLLLAGVTTTSNTFYAAINILAHHQNIQTRMLEEIQTLSPGCQVVSLDLRPKMHYCRAFILELLRYTSVVANSVSHRAVADETIQGYFIPKDTRIQVSIYGFHHDPEFWKDPGNFRPERFLDENQELVAADHPNRKHMIPFGAGPRVCLGETLALTRLFLWITTFVNRFSVVPADGNDPSTLDTKQFYFIGVLRPTPYEINLSMR